MSRLSLLINRIVLATSVALGALVVVAVAMPAADGAATTDSPSVEEATAAEPAVQQVALRRYEVPRVATGAIGEDGEALTISCSTCHAMLEPNRELRSADELKQFHQGLHFQHGSNSCLACHNPDDYDSLRLADGRRVAFTESIELCSQCHGPQRRDFDRAAHGGMSGYWDLSRGGQVRNTCLNCHDAHVPTYQSAIPLPGPRDRFLLPTPEHSGDAHD